jgi:3-oxoacyl-[acyl-carrier protein] reductase
MSTVPSTNDPGVDASPETASGERGRRVAVVTGGAGLIGRAIVDELKRHGHRALALDRAGDISCDLSSEESTRAAAAEVLERHGRCDILVHCAAAFNAMQLADVDLAGWRHVQSVNVESLVLLSRAFAPVMAAQGFGRIIVITSDTVWLPPPAAPPPYIVSKAALVGLTRALALRLGKDGIAVSAVAPGLTDTPAARGVNTDEAFDEVVAAQALPRRLVPEDVAATVAFLASDGAAALTGQVLCTDGGLVLR